MEHRLSFSCDYLEGAHPAILQRLCETNFAQTAGYGTDEYCESAREKIRAACGAPNAEIHFLVGGTQTNATVIDALLRSYEGVIAADTGHISVHEAGAIEFGGHKVLTLPQENGKITASQICALLDQYEDDANRDHTVMPGMVYLSQPTEYGTLYSKKELGENLTELNIGNELHVNNDITKKSSLLLLLFGKDFLKLFFSYKTFLYQILTDRAVSHIYYSNPPH